MTIVVWDHLMTLSDEVKYVWKKEKFWSKSHQISSQNEVLTIVQPSGFLSWFVPIGLSALGGC